MKKTLLIVLLLSSIIFANPYIEQIKVIDKCTYLVEPLTIESLGIKGAKVKDLEAQKAIRACEKSLKAHPNDPHVQFLLARAYTKGTNYNSDIGFPKSVRLLIPELNDVAGKYDKGYYLAKKSCQNGDLGGCDLLAFYAHKGLYNKEYSSKKAYLLWLWSCQLGNMKSCQNLSAIVKKGLYVPKDLEPDYKYSFKACKSKMYPRACEVLEDQLSLKNYPFDKDTIQYIYYQSCISGSYNGCYFLEKTLDQNRSENQDKLFYVIKKSCNGGSAKSCRKLGELYAKLPKSKINNIMAYTFFEDACTNGEVHFACKYAGYYKIYPKEGIEQDIDLGISQWEKSCYTGNNAFACYDLASFFIYTDNIKYKNKENAIKPLEHACRGYGNGYAEALGCKQGIKSCCKHSK